MNIEPRPLSGCVVGLSIADGEDSAALGFPQSEVNRTALRIVAALLGQGAGVSFGHDWRDDGVMEAVHAYVERFRPLAPEGQPKPLLWNFVAWPDKPRLDLAERERLRDTLRVEEAGLPEPLHQYAAEADILRHTYFRARGLTYLRHKLTERSNARVCLGGRVSTYAGRYPGIVEEALFAIRARQPLYIAALLGGATKQIVLALQRENRPQDLCRNEKQLALYENPRVREMDPLIHEDMECSPEKVWGVFADFGISGLAERNGLSSEENERLFNTQVIDEAIGLTLTGLGRLAQK